MSRLERRRAERSRQPRNRKTLLVLTLVALLIAVASASYIYFGGLTVSKPKRQADFATGQHKVNILVLGVDERPGDKGRSDTMFVISVDQKSGETALLSIPRDTRVKIPGRGWDKINHAYAEGGHELSRKAVEGLLGIPIDYDMVIDFSAFYKIVDAVGGVDVAVEKRMYYEDPYDDLIINLKPGPQHMDGKTAIQYVRYRDGDGDLGRIERQQNFIKAMLKEVASPAVIPRIPAIIKEVSAAIKTDLSPGDMVNLAKMFNDAARKGLKTDTVPGKPAYIADISYWIPDVTGLREHVAQLQGIPLDEKYLAVARSLQAEYDASIPKEMKIIEVPKNVLPQKSAVAPANPTAPVSPKGTDKPASTSAPVQPSKPVVADDKIRVEIVNTSGAADAGDKAASLLRSQGFEIASVTSGNTANRNTVIVSHTTNSAVVSKLTSLPFRYALQVTKNDSKANVVTVILGKDFVEK